MRTLYSAVLFQTAWLLCVFGGDRVALITLAVYLCIHFRYISQSVHEWTFMLAVAAIGIGLDHLAIAAALYEVPDGRLPIWLACLWFLFGAMMPHGLAWLRGRPFAAAIMGAIGGSASYAAGLRLGLITSEHVTTTLFWWAAQWSILLPALMRMYQSWPGCRPSGQAAERTGG